MSIPMRVQAVIFDMDGVLTDSEPLINAAAVQMFRELGLTVQPRDFDPFVGTGEDRYLGGVAEQYEFAIELCRGKQRLYEIYLARVSTELNAFPGAVELVQATRQAGLKVALASSADRIKIDANLARIGIPQNHWGAIISAEDVSHRKPAPDIFLKAANALSVAPADCLVIEDAPNGITAAKSAEMTCFAVAHTFPAEQLRDADRAFAKLSDVSLDDLFH